MNSKELLEQADERAGKLRDLSMDLRKIEDAIEAAQTGLLLILHAGEYTNLQQVFDKERLDDTQKIVKANLIGFRNEKAEELEQLLGYQPESIPVKAMGSIYTSTYNADATLTCKLDQAPDKRKPATINPEFEAAVQDMERSGKKPDPVEEKLSEILQKEAKRIESKPVETDSSLDKYPDGKKKASAYPDSMTVDSVRDLYINQGKTINQIANIFGVTYQKASNFITIHKLHRNTKKLPETERP